MGCPYLFRRVWPRSYHWDAVHTVDDVDLPRCHSWVKRHPKNLGLSRSKEPGCMRSAHVFSTWIMERSMDLICSERSHILNFCVQVYSFPACFQHLRISPASPVAKPFTTARPCNRSIDHGTTGVETWFVNHRQGFMLFSQWKGRLFLQIPGYAFLMFANIVNLPTFSEYIVIWTANLSSD